VSVAVSAASGATGVGLGRVVAKNTARIAARVVLNSAGSALIGAGGSVVNTVGTNIVEGNEITENLTTEGVLQAAAVNGVLGAAGSVSDEIATGAARLVARNAYLDDLVDPSVPFYAVGNRSMAIEATGTGVGNALGVAVSNSGLLVDEISNTSTSGN
jgi:hypothetical protein